MEKQEIKINFLFTELNRDMIKYNIPASIALYSLLVMLMWFTTVKRQNKFWNGKAAEVSQGKNSITSKHFSHWDHTTKSSCQKRNSLELLSIKQRRATLHGKTGMWKAWLFIKLTEILWLFSKVKAIMKKLY